MLLKYGFSNFLSFNNYVEFSMLAPSNIVKKRFPDNYVSLTNGYDVNKTAVIVGENAGGKTNFVRSIGYFKTFLTTNEPVSSAAYWIHINNFDKCLKKANTKQTFYFEISDDEFGLFIYSLEIDFLGIVNEKLICQKSKEKKPRLIVSASRNDVERECDESKCEINKCNLSGKVVYEIMLEDKDISKDAKEMLEKSTSKAGVIGLFVTKAALLGSLPAIKFVNVILNDILPVSKRISSGTYETINNEQRDIEIIRDKRFFDVFRIVDYSIIDIEVNDEDPFRKTKIIRKRKDGTVFSRELARDSSGVFEFFTWAIRIFKVIYENKIIIADEMDRVLNPVLSDRIVSLVNGSDHTGQFIFTSHNVLHLDLKNYMKEQIYFITKDVENLESDMYSLSEFPEVRYETTKVYEFYLKGILGGTASE